MLHIRTSQKLNFKDRNYCITFTSSFNEYIIGLHRVIPAFEGNTKVLLLQHVFHVIQLNV